MAVEAEFESNVTPQLTAVGKSVQFEIKCNGGSEGE
jgi:hypothetical protein